MRRVEELRAEGALRSRQQALLVTVVVAVPARQGELGLLEWAKHERRAVIASVEYHPHSALHHETQQLGDGGDAIVRVGHQADAHQLLHSGSSTSCCTSVS